MVICQGLRFHTLHKCLKKTYNIASLRVWVGHLTAGALEEKWMAQMDDDDDDDDDDGDDDVDGDGDGDDDGAADDDLFGTLCARTLVLPALLVYGPVPSVR